MTRGNETRRGFLKVSGVAVAGLLSSGQGSAASLGIAEGTLARTAFDVREFGAKGDGKNLDTPAINKAIEALLGGLHPAWTNCSKKRGVWPRSWFPGTRAPARFTKLLGSLFSSQGLPQPWTHRGSESAL